MCHSSADARITQHGKLCYVLCATRTHTAALCLLFSCTGASVGGARMKRLTRELRDLTGKFALPCNPAASIFLRHDGDHLDKMRAIITGGGCVYTG